MEVQFLPPATYGQPTANKTATKDHTLRKGANVRKLIIGVTQELADTPEIKALSTRTCDVRVVNLDEYDIVMSTKAWFMPQVNLRYLAPAIKMVRKSVKLKEI